MLYIMSNIPSFEEKSIWVQMLATISALSIYSASAIPMMNDGILDLDAYLPFFGGAVVLLIVVIVVGQILATMTGAAEDADERDRLIAWKADSRSSWLMGIGSFTAMSALLFNIEAVWIAHILLLSLYLSEILKSVLQIVDYRRGT